VSEEIMKTPRSIFCENESSIIPDFTAKRCHKEAVILNLSVLFSVKALRIEAWTKKRNTFACSEIVWRFVCDSLVGFGSHRRRANYRGPPSDNRES